MSNARDKEPTAVLAVPVVLSVKVVFPIATLQPPVKLGSFNARLPSATLFVPVG